MKWSDLLPQEFEGTYRAVAGLFNEADGIDLNWKPSQDNNWMTLGQLLMHCTNACGFCCRGFVTGDWGMPEGAKMEDMPAEEMMPPAEKMPTVESLAQAKEMLEADKKMALAAVAEAGEERLENERSTPPWGGPEFNLGQHLLHMNEHLSIHRAQLFYYLKLHGKPVHTGTMWGMGG